MFSRKLVERYRELKKEAVDFILLMQAGAFMQVLDEDARSVSRVTVLKLQMTGDVDDPVVRGGFPKAGLNAYVGRLVRAGHSVAIAFQDANTQRLLSEVTRLHRDVIRGKAPWEGA